MRLAPAVAAPECEDLREDTEEDGEDEEGNDVCVQDEGPSDKEQQEDPEGAPEQEESQSNGEDFLETFMAAWQTKKKTIQHCLQRGFWECQVDCAPISDERDAEERRERCLIILKWSGCQESLQPARGVQSDRTLPQ